MRCPGVPRTAACSASLAVTMVVLSLAAVVMVPKGAEGAQPIVTVALDKANHKVEVPGNQTVTIQTTGMVEIKASCAHGSLIWVHLYCTSENGNATIEPTVLLFSNAGGSSQITMTVFYEPLGMNYSVEDVILINGTAIPEDEGPYDVPETKATTSIFNKDFKEEVNDDPHGLNFTSAEEPGFRPEPVHIITAVVAAILIAALVAVLRLPPDGQEDDAAMRRRESRRGGERR